MRRSQNRPELGNEQSWLGQAEPNGTQTECRVWRDSGKSVQAFFVFIGPKIEGAHRHRLAAHSGSDLTVRLELLVLRRQALAIEKQELAAKQTDAGCTVLQRLREIVRELDVRE